PAPATATPFPYTTLFRSTRRAGTSGGRILKFSGRSWKRLRRGHVWLRSSCGARSPFEKRGKGNERRSIPHRRSFRSANCIAFIRSEEHTSELQSRVDLVC